jgi:hypothetical protein
MIMPRHLRQRRLGLRQPECHLHRTIQLDGGDQFSAGLLPSAGRYIQGAETQVTVGLQWTHAECLGQGQGLLVVGFGLSGIGGIGVGMDDAKLVQRECLVPAFLELPDQLKRLVGVLPGFLAASR